MKKIIALMGVAVFVVVACGGPGATCRERSAADCEKQWTCDAGFMFGSSQADCTMTLQMICDVSGGNTCSQGQTFNGAKAAECATAVKAQSCAQWRMGQPAACTMVCQ
jgi:hypothetical protein